jgi:hypothetical protein
MDGWDLLNAVTARLIPGTQAQKVILVALELQDAPPASTEALGLALLPPVLVLAGAAPPPLLLPPQAASRATADRPASPAVTRPVTCLFVARRGPRSLDLDNMMA